MYQRNIKLSRETVKEFVSAACKCDFSVQIRYGKGNYVNAKSIMGVFSLDLSDALTVAYPQQDENFENILNQYSVA